MPFKNFVGKSLIGESADHQHFLLFPSCFYSLKDTVETVLSSQPEDKPKVAAYDSWLLNTDQYFLEW